MTELGLILIGTVLVNNFVLVRFLGLCPFMGVSNKLSGALGMAAATTFVLTLASALAWLIEHFLLDPFGLEYLRALTFILAIAALVQFTEVLLGRVSPVLHRMLGIYLPLITTNCAVLGVALLNTQLERGFPSAVVFGFGAGAGFGLVLILFAAMRERLTAADVPASFRGAPIGLITAGMMALAFMGFAGLLHS